jgi:hypothetical protein
MICSPLSPVTVVAWSRKGAGLLQSAPLPEKARQGKPCRASLRSGETSLYLAEHFDDLLLSTNTKRANF